MSFLQHYIDEILSQHKFFSQLNRLINWEPIKKELQKVYKRGCKAYKESVENRLFSKKGKNHGY